MNRRLAMPEQFARPTPEQNSRPNGVPGWDDPLIIPDPRNHFKMEVTVVDPEAAARAAKAAESWDKPLPRVKELGEIADDLNTFTAGLDRNADPGEIGDKIYRFVVDNKIRTVLEGKNYTADELEAVLKGLDALSVLEGNSLSLMGWSFIKDAAGSQALKELSARGGAIDDIIARGIADDEWRTLPIVYESLVQATYYATSGRFGGIEDWRKNGEVAKTNESVQTLAAHSRLPQAYVDISSERIAEQHNLDGAQRILAYRAVEKATYEQLLGLPPHMSQDIRLATSTRTLMRDDKGTIIPMRKGGGVDTNEWKRVTHAMINARHQLGSKGMQRLYNDCGIVNFDRYSMDQLDRMDLLTTDDPARIKELAEFIAELQTNDVRIMISDAFGDHNGAFTNASNVVDTNAGTGLFFEVRGLSGLYRPFVFLNRLGVKPASAVLALHGMFGSMSIGAEGGNQFTLTGEVTRNPDGSPATPGAVAITGAQLERLFTEYMQEGKNSGLREIILLSCFQAQDIGEKGEKITPTAEHIAGAARPEDNVIVYAGTTPLNIANTPRGEITYLQPDPAKPDNGKVSTPLEAQAYRSRHRQGMRTGRVVTHETVKTIPRM